eukprot:12971944-Ditylum_brightwellii.AAC.1
MALVLIICRLENGVVTVVLDVVVVAVWAVFVALAMVSFALAKCLSAAVVDCCICGKDAA